MTEQVSGRIKNALLQDTEVTITYQETKPPGFFTAQFYLYQILSTIFPDNFPGVISFDPQSITFSRVRSPELLKAQQIRNKYKARGELGSLCYWTETEREWIEAQQIVTGNLPEFASLMNNLVAILTPTPDTNPQELALPDNTTIVNGHPVIVEVFDPIIETVDSSGSHHFQPTLNTQAVNSLYNPAGTNETLKQYCQLYDKHVQTLL